MRSVKYGLSGATEYESCPSFWYHELHKAAGVVLPHSLSIQRYWEKVDCIVDTRNVMV